MKWSLGGQLYTLHFLEMGRGASFGLDLPRVCGTWPAILSRNENFLASSVCFHGPGDRMTLGSSLTDTPL